MLEKDVERRLRDGVKNMGGWCLKAVCPGFTGMPDRLVLLPGHTRGHMGLWDKEKQILKAGCLINYYRSLQK